MDYREDQTIVDFRNEVQTFISDNLPDDWGSGSGGEGYEADVMSLTRSFQTEMAKRRWLTMAWPKEHGGLDAPHSQQMIMAEEMAYHRAPGGGSNMGVHVGGALVDALRHGRAEGRAPGRHRRTPRPGGARCTPSLARVPTSPRCRPARSRTADDYVINGQKIWTSGAHVSDWGWLAARTDPDAPKHKGITMFMMRMDTPGVTVRPLINMADGHGFNEVFFEDVRIPQTNVVGGGQPRLVPPGRSARLRAQWNWRLRRRPAHG